MACDPDGNPDHDIHHINALKEICHNPLTVRERLGHRDGQCSGHVALGLLGVGARRVELQTRFFILGRVRQHAEPDLMPLVHPFQRNMGAIVIVGS